MGREKAHKYPGMIGSKFAKTTVLTFQIRDKDILRNHDLISQSSFSLFFFIPDS